MWKSLASRAWRNMLLHIDIGILGRQHFGVSYCLHLQGWSEIVGRTRLWGIGQSVPRMWKLWALPIGRPHAGNRRHGRGEKWPFKKTKRRTETRKVSPKSSYALASSHDVKTQNTNSDIFTAVRTENLVYIYMLLRPWTLQYCLKTPLC